ncbi:hypothetical protein ACFFMM_11575 [Micromonospora chaiyaphumensis]|uniref:EcsC protein family protein n=1 Tax=Micromonospora chaiyaphumensis TaxID=307119 RepID=A0A1C4W9W7_9ACTN|nr:hypothetical protein [Micromonospora chaiyaphumensis]SCE92761.1 hypothetical protein GA0070214_103352 [Micromonospora chaiyaphumensis]
MTDAETITLQAELPNDDAEREIAKAVSARHAIARKYVKRVRKRNPDATPAEVITMLERHYVTAITVAGGIVTVGSIAAAVGIALIPGGGATTAAKTVSTQAAKKAGKVAAKKAGKEVAKKAAKGLALNAAKTGAQRVAALLPAGDEQLQFEITAIFALAIADIHGMALDRDQAHALVYGLSNERVSQKQIAAMANDLASASTDGIVGVGHSIASGRKDWSHWANTLADTLPGGAAQDLVRTVQTGRLETVRSGLNGKQQAAVEYGVGAVAGGVARFVFGREVVEAARTAFAEAPPEFPDHLTVPINVTAEEEEDEPNPALVALEDAAKATGTWVANAAVTVTRPFRSVDLDGDGVPDEPQALTAVKGVGGAIAGVAGTVGEGVTSLFKPKKRGKHAAGEPRREIEAAEASDGQ